MHAAAHTAAAASGTGGSADTEVATDKQAVHTGSEAGRRSGYTGEFIDQQA